MLNEVYWCHKKGAWIKILKEENQYNAYVARDSGWVKIEGECIWEVFYSARAKDDYEPVAEHTVIGISNHNLYQIYMDKENAQIWNDTAKDPAWQHLAKGRLLGTHEIFKNLEKGDPKNALSKEKLPPVPDKKVVQEDEKKEEPVKEEPIKIDQKQTTEQDIWNKIKKDYVTLFRIRSITNFFKKNTEIGKSVLELDDHLHPQQFDTPEAYLTAIESMLTRREDQHNNSLFALRTLMENDELYKSLEKEIFSHLLSERNKVLALLGKPKNDLALAYPSDYSDTPLFWYSQKRTFLRFQDPTASEYKFQISPKKQIWEDLINQDPSKFLEVNELGADRLPKKERIGLQIFNGKVYKTNFQKNEETQAYLLEEWNGSDWKNSSFEYNDPGVKPEEKVITTLIEKYVDADGFVRCIEENIAGTVSYRIEKSTDDKHWQEAHTETEYWKVETLDEPRETYVIGLFNNAFFKANIYINPLRGEPYVETWLSANWKKAQNNPFQDKFTFEVKKPIEEPIPPKKEAPVLEAVTDLPEDYAGEFNVVLEPYWAEKEKKWMRFVEVNGNYYVQWVVNNHWIFRQKEALPTVYSDTLNANNCWFATHHYKEAFALIDNKIYRSTLEKDAHDLRYYDYFETDQFKRGKQTENPFGDMDFPTYLTITEYQALPLTPEQLAAEAAAKQAEAAAQKERWAAFRKSLVEINKLNSQPWEVLMHNEIQGLFDVNLFNDAESYLCHLEYLLTVENYSFNNTSVTTLASLTNIDRDCELNPDDLEARRNELYENKQKYIYEIVTLQRESLLNFLNKEPTPLENCLPIKSLQSPQERVMTEEMQLQEALRLSEEGYQEEERLRVEQENIALQNAIDVSQREEENEKEKQEIANAIDASLREEESKKEKEEIQNAIDLSLKKEENEDEKAPKEREIDWLDALKKATTSAVDKYGKWYEGAELRGPDGLFSRFWFRHGKKGQVAAKNLLKKVNDATDYESAINEIQTVLLSSKTRYHRHSFASFLLDELKELDGLPWHKIKPDKENHYNQSDVAAIENVKPKKSS